MADNRGGTLFLYQSPNLTDWEYAGLLTECEMAKTGFECECPDLFALGGRMVFISSSHKTWWQASDYAWGRFTADAWGPADTGKFCAAKTLLDDQGRRLLLGWVQEDQPEAEQQAAGWSGLLSLPRWVSLLPDGTAGFAPVPELQALREAHRHWDGFMVPEGRGCWTGFTGTCWKWSPCCGPATQRRSAFPSAAARTAPAGWNCYGIGLRKPSAAHRWHSGRTKR